MDTERFRAELRRWLADALSGPFAAVRGAGGPGREHEQFAERLAWERALAAAGWNCVDWPVAYGGRGGPAQWRWIVHEECARADAPARVSHLGQELLGPTLLAHGTEDQKRRFLPEIAAVRELWCQGYSEPGAGSDLAAVATTARREDGEWVLHGQKVWTSLAQHADWCFVLARTEPGSRRHHGLSYLLVPMDQPGVTVRPIRQLTGTAEFNEVFFDGARTAADLVVGEPGAGWAVAMSTLDTERGAATAGQQIGFRRELAALTALAEANGAAADPLTAQRIAEAWLGFEVMTAYREHGDHAAPGAAAVAKLVWANWHRDLGELAMRIRGPAGLTYDGELDDWQRLYLFSRADTIYGGSNEIQRTILAERVLGLPKEPRPC